MMNSKYIKSLTLGLMLCVGCATNPVTGEREFSVVSDAQARQIGEAQYREGQQTQGGVYYLDPQLNAYVAEVGQKLAEVSDVPNLNYEFVVLNNPVPNAWALPGGKIAVNRGLLTQLDNEAQLAAVIGHEIVHAAAGHGASQMSRSVLINLGISLAGAATASTDYGDLVRSGSELGAAAWMASYGREDELEADEYGMLYMSRAGYDPQGAVELQRTFVRLSEGRNPGFAEGLFASHPPSQQRVEANMRLASELPSGETGREAFLQATQQLRRDQEAYEAHEQAITALQNNDPQAALGHIDDAIALQPREGQFWELRGDAYRLLNNSSQAENNYSRAIEENPNYYRHWAARGALRESLGRTQAAEQDYQQARALLN
jgi:predicted Zn-dependent protease